MVINIMEELLLVKDCHGGILSITVQFQILFLWLVPGCF